MSERRSSGGGCGLSLGGVVALLLSLKTWGFTWWAVLHALLGWVYVIYWLLFYSFWRA